MGVEPRSPRLARVAIEASLTDAHIVTENKVKAEQERRHCYTSGKADNNCQRLDSCAPCMRAGLAAAGRADKRVAH
eukprot:scaffold158_cov388-Prasinococcus_capsulatus_cf.AAC.14